MKDYYIMPDTNKKYNITIGMRGCGKRHRYYKIRKEYLENLGEFITRGFTDTLLPSDERLINCAFVGLIKAQENFRKMC